MSDEFDAAINNFNHQYHDIANVLNSADDF